VLERLAVRQDLIDQGSHGRGPVEVEVPAADPADASLVGTPTTAAHHTLGPGSEDNADDIWRALTREGKDFLA
jgi:hypothetical protein